MPSQVDPAKRELVKVLKELARRILLWTRRSFKKSQGTPSGLLGECLKRPKAFSAEPRCIPSGLPPLLDINLIRKPTGQSDPYSKLMMPISLRKMHLEPLMAKNVCISLH